MKQILLLIWISLAVQFSQAQTLTPFERDAARNTSATYAEAIDFYEQLAARYPQQFQFLPYGETDSGQALHLGVLSDTGTFAPDSSSITILINNAIHAGEPCGVDATMLLVRDYLEKKNISLGKHLQLVFIPFYNISGGLNRGAYSRANQMGPKAHGFRANAQNLDLNRDFIKCDSRNAKTFNQLYTQWRPDIFIDNHTSNGADYQYTLTLIPTQHNKLSTALSAYLQNNMLPFLYKDMARRGWEMTPYVYARDTPDQGIYGFLDLPRYSSGYAALHHALSFMPETHMLKPFGDRVQSVYAFMRSVLTIAQHDREIIRATRASAIEADRAADSLALQWQLDPSRADTILFKGYTAKYRPSAISDMDRLYYDRDQPFAKLIPHFNYYKPTHFASVPNAYIIPQAWASVVDRLRWNGVELSQLRDSVTLSVEQSYIVSYESRDTPYEGHYLHTNVETRQVQRSQLYRAGDYIVFTDQPAIRYIVETLEPTAPDSYFAWNFFDAILQQKEYFSSYVFEDTAAELLKQQPELAAALARAKQQDTLLRQNARMQLDFIYKRSSYYEPTHQLYPIARWNGARFLPLNNESDRLKK